ncbi:hypothetical protein MTO96_025133 [Rhipicephalus appendiculatus]
MEGTGPTIMRRPGTEGWESIVGHSRPTVWKAINAFRSEEATVTMKMAQSRVVAPPKNRSKSAVMAVQQRLHNLCEDYTAGRTKVEDFLRAVGHTIRF